MRMRRLGMQQDPLAKAFKWGDLFRAVWYFLGSERSRFLFWTTTLFVVYFYQLVPSYLVGQVVDFFTGYQPGQSLDFFYLLVGILTVSHMAVAVIRLTGKNKVSNMADELKYRGRIQGFEKLLEHSIAWHEHENTGNKVQRIQEGMRSIKDMIRLLAEEVFKMLTGFIGVFFFFLWHNLWMFLFLVVYLGVFFSIQVSFSRRRKKLLELLQLSTEKSSGAYYESLNNVLTIKTMGAKDAFRRKISEQEEHVRDLHFQIRQLGFFKWRVFHIFNDICTFVFLLILGQGVVAGAISIGSILIFYSYFGKVTDYATEVGEKADSLLEYKSAVARMMPIFWEHEEQYQGDLPFPENWQTLEIQGGSFAYKKNQPEFDLTDIHLKITRGKKVGIVGKSGSGKSTLAKLLLGIYRLNQGNLKVDEISLDQIRHAEITHRFAVVLQESELFNFSLRDNITLMREVSLALFTRAIEIAQLPEVIAKLPEGLDTLIGEKGYRVSGGERQRIAMARAICKDPEILILDEATSQLDSKTEAKVQQALERELPDLTMVIIAHRFSTLKNVHRVYVFDQGRIIEEGSFEELLKQQDSLFARLYQEQHRQFREEPTRS